MWRLERKTWFSFRRKFLSEGKLLFGKDHIIGENT